MILLPDPEWLRIEPLTVSDRPLHWRCIFMWAAGFASAGGENLRIIDRCARQGRRSPLEPGSNASR